MLTITAAFALAVPPLLPPEPPPRVRPVNELHCIYDEASEATRNAAARHMWVLDRDSQAMVDLLYEAQDACRHRHNWDSEELVMAYTYVQGAVFLDFARARLSAMHIDPTRLDRIYRAGPVGERTQRDSNVASRRWLAELQRDRARYATDPDIVSHGAVFLYALASVERTERMWLRLTPFSWF
jgi:hypothetical protein